MRNISVIQDHLAAVGGDASSSSPIVSIALNHTHHRLYSLTEDGILSTYDISDHFRFLSSTKLEFDDVQEQWFGLDFLIIGSTVVALSREGSIVTADDNGENDSGELENVDQIGVIEGGIHAASWSPDYSCLAILTGNNTMLLMSNSWEPISEIDFPAFNPQSPVGLSWKGDGELLSVVSQDASDNTYHARIYNKSLQLTATGRNVADGPAAILKGLGGCTAFAPNGTLVAVYQRRAAELPQVAFIEKNGLRHGDFDLRKPPPVPNDIQVGDWDVKHLSWDMTSTVVAVSWSAPIVSSSSSSVPSTGSWGCVQLYYRENYYWYLKQQWTGFDLAFLTFDNEVQGRLYMRQTATVGPDQWLSPAIRTVDTFWKIASSHCRDGTVTVTDGDTQHFTPLGYNNVPPPMSMFQEKWSSLATVTGHQQTCARSISFWHVTTVGHADIAWGAAVLLNEDGLVSFVFGNARGRITRGGYLRIPNPHRAALREITILPLQTSDETLKSGGGVKLAVVAVGSLAYRVDAQHTHAVAKDLLFVVHLDEDALCRPATSEAVAFTHHYVIDNLPGTVYALTSIVGETHALAVGMKDHETANFDVYRLDFAHAYADLATEESLPANATIDFTAFPQEHLLVIPEICPQFYVVVNPTTATTTAAADQTTSAVAMPSSYYSHTVISLSLKNRLYVGEVLVVPGASSFAFNHAYNMLLFITVGTKPMLHFVTFGTLLKINPLMGEDQQDLFEAAEPRPVERGARLIASIEYDSKIIIQLPRGNLETFEPRPLIILRAQQLLNQRKVADCLLLLRLQRIDLNYLVDFDPTIFFAELAQWIPEALQKKADLLSLFITSLETVDVTTTKYVLFDETSLENRQRRRSFVDSERFVGDEKINVICRRMREELLRYLAALQATTASAMAASVQQQTTVLNAVLCTYAKQRPPLLVDALHFIQAQQQRAIATAAAVSTTAGTRLLQVAAIKYLVFLVDGSQLFDAAVGDCVFDLARAVARQCQMDPKVYLPLLEKFESIGRGHAVGSLPHLLMHLHVQHHLTRVWATVDDFVRLLSQWYEAESEAAAAEADADAGGAAEASLVTIEQVQHARRLAEEMIATVVSTGTSSGSSGGSNGEDATSLMTKLLPALVALEVRMEDDLSSSSSSSSSATKASVTVTRQFLTATRALYAQQCLQQMQYTPAIHAFLTCYPPMGQRAVDAAMAAGDWKQALSLANRFASATLSPLKIVQDIVSNFKQNQDDSATFASAMEVAAITVTQTIGTAVTENRSLAVQAAISATMATGQQIESKAMEAAAFCVEYLNDVESAVTILTTAQHLATAMDYAGRFNRRDLYDEIYAALRLTVEDTIATLEERTASFPQAARILKELWTPPSATTGTTATNTAAAAVDGDEDEAPADNTAPLDRLHQVAQHDRMLQRILERLEQGDDYDDAVQPSNNANGGGGDSASVINDNASDFSAASKYSLLSLRSARSTQSGVSVQSAQSRTSQYSLSSEASTTSTSAASSSSSSAAFSIQGLEHTLLSRGTVDPNAPPPNTGANKPFHGGQQKRGKQQPMSKNARRRQRAAEEVEELRRERERALLDPATANADTTIKPGNEDSDYARRRQRRQERARYKAQEKNKDEAGLKRESDQVDALWQAVASLPFAIHTMRDLCHLLALNHGDAVADHVLSIRLQTAMDQYVSALQTAMEMVPAAPEYPLPWLQQRNMPHVQFFQDVRALYQHILQWRVQSLQQSLVKTDNSAAATTTPVDWQQLSLVRVEDMAMLRRYEYDVWHVLKQGVQLWTQTKQLVRQQPV